MLDAESCCGDGVVERRDDALHLEAAPDAGGIVRRPDDDRTPTPAEQIAGTMFDPPIHRMARARDPQTSKTAAVQAIDLIASDHRRWIVEALDYFGVHGGTAKEIAARIGPDFSSVQVTRRLVELRASGHVTTFDGLALSHPLEPGHEDPRIVRQGCAVHVKAEHREAARVIEAAEETRRRQTKLAQGMIA